MSPEEAKRLVEGQEVHVYWPGARGGLVDRKLARNVCLASSGPALGCSMLSRCQMPCNVYRSEDGEITAIVCSRGRQPRKLCSCGRPATLLCDWPLAGPKVGKTCDRPLFRACAKHAGKDLDYCPGHARMADHQPELPK